MVDKEKKAQDQQPDDESLGRDRGVGVDEESGQVYGTGDGTSADFVNPLGYAEDEEDDEEDE